jgi:hypothetical protein
MKSESQLRVLGPFAALALAVAAPATAQDLQILHDGVGCVVAGQYPRFDARFEPPASVGRARIHFRSPGSPVWYYVDMAPSGDVYVGVLPKPQPSLKRFAYYVEVAGTSLQTSRTRDYEPVVVGGALECDPKAALAQISSVGPAVVGAPAGAPAAPPGFSPLATPGVATSTAAAGAAAGGGLSTAAIAGIVAGGAAAVGGAVAVAGSKDSGESTGGSSPPASSAPPAAGGTAGGGGGGRAPQTVNLALSNNCTLYGGTAIYAGDTVVISRGMCPWKSAEEARAGMAGQTVTLTVDGVPLQPVRYSIGDPHGIYDIYCASGQADWKATAGHHVAAGVFSLPGSPVDSCPFDVAP